MRNPNGPSVEDIDDWNDALIEAAGDDERESFGCVLPSKCCMPSLHYPSECHTAEMMEQINEEFERSELHGEG